MQPERVRLFIERIKEHIDTVRAHYTENPVFAHDIRMADTIGTIFAVLRCLTTKEHWECYCETSGMVMHLMVLAIINPKVLDDIYKEFKEDFQQLLPSNYVHWPIIECREYPFPEEVLPCDEQEGDGLDDC